MKIDDDTQKALLLFNRRADAAEAARAAERRLAKAIRSKDDAAEALKRAQNSGGGAEVVSEAESTWREAVDLWQRLRDGEEVPEPETAPAGQATEEGADEAPADEAPADEAPADEAPADEAPDEEDADEAPADEATDEEDADEAPAAEATDEEDADEAPAAEATDEEDAPAAAPDEEE
jgi:hypothetical protein